MIYLFDKDERLIKLVKKDAIKSALQKFTLTTDRYVSDRLTVEMLDLTAQELEQVEYMAIQSIDDAHKFHFFYIAQKFSEKLTTLIGVQSGIEELRKSVVLDKRPQNTFARPVINELLAGTNWQARFVSETSQRTTNFYYISTFEALKKVCDVWNLEMQFFVEMNGNKIGARYIDFKQRIGEATGKRVVYGHNALQILQEVERTNLFTALIGRGKGEEVSASNEGGQAGYGRRLNFENVVWEKAKGAPVDKPKGQKYVELPEMTKKYGIKNADGTMRAKIGFVVFQEEEDANVLIRRTYEQLVNASRPQLTLKTSTVYLKDVNIGDTIRVVRHDKKLDYDTRIFDITFDRLNDESNDIKLGDRISESNEAKIQNIASQKADELISSSFNGLIKNLPDFLPSADGLNKNWYGANDPTKTHVGKVGINDIWFKPNPEHEGQTIMLRWTGEVWEEVIRSNSDQEIIDEISKRFERLYLTDINEARSNANQALRTAWANADLANEAKRLSERISGDMTTFKSDYQADLNGINLIINQTTANNGQMFSAFTSNINGRMAEMASKVEGKVNQADFQRVKETAQLYERILGNTDNGIANNVARMALTNQLFQVEVAKASAGGRNLFLNSLFKRDLHQHYSTYHVDDSVEQTQRQLALSIDTNTKFRGANTLKIVSTFNGKANNQKVTFRTGGDMRLNTPDEMRNKSVRFSFWAKSTVNNTNFQARAGYRNTVEGVSLTTDWKFYDIQLIKSENSNASNEVIMHVFTAATVWIAFPKVEVGTVSTDFSEAPEDTNEAIRSVQTQLSNSWAVQNLTSAGDVLGAINLNPDGSVKINEGLISVGDKTYIKDGVIKKSMIGKAQIGTAHIGEIDASKANIINISAKNIITEGLTANIIRGGKLSSLNGKSDFDLQTGWIEMNQEAVGIRNRFPGKPMQFLIFGQGSLNGVGGAYTQLMSNRNGVTGIEHTSAGIQIWNGRQGENIQTAITFYGKSMDFMPNSLGGGITVNTENRTISNLDNIYFRGTSLVTILDLINKNFEGIATHFEYNRLGAPGRYKVSV